MDVLVMGTGGVGGYLGALLARSGHRLTAMARGAHLDAIQKNGLHIETAIEDDFTVPVHALPLPEPNRTFDLIIMAVKSYDIDEAIGLIRHAVGPDSTVLTLLNGVESGERLAAAFGPERVLDGLIYIESFIKEPGVIAQVGGPRRIVFGNRNSANAEREDRFLQEFLAAGWNAELSDDIIDSLWSKFVYLGPYAALNTVTGLSSGEMCATEEGAALMRTTVEEYVAVGNADGASLGTDVVDNVMGRYRESMIGMTSMLRDRTNGRRIEHEALVGSVVRRGQALGVSTPTTGMLYGLLSPIAALAPKGSV